MSRQNLMCKGIENYLLASERDEKKFLEVVDNGK